MSSIHQKFRRTSFIFDNPQKCVTLIANKPQSERVIIVSSNSSVFFLVHEQEQTLTCIKPSEINQFLGQEFDCILFDLSDEFNVNAFTAITGCLVGGGELILNLPKDLGDSVCPLLTRFLTEIEPQASLQQPEVKTSDNFLSEQKQLIEKIERCALGHARRPLVITANRGRGKSTALGIASTKLAKEKNKKIIITAPRKANVKIFFQYIKQQSIDTERVLFIPPDQLIKDTPNADLVIIDEAGAIPIQILEKIISNYNRMIFSTTTDGYEGNGQGFKIRFQSKLAERFPQWRAATLNTPMRWAIDDPLEAALNKAFMLSYENDSPSLKIEVPLLQLNKIHYQLISKSQLLADEKLLKQIYTLLVEAHYQTRPSDLQKILSDESMQVYAAINKYDDSNKDKVIATALVCAEGQLSDTTCIAIEKGEKRLAGHLLPQSLMAYQGYVSAGKLSYWRIMRVAVSPEVQRKKIGSQLLQFIEKEANKNSIDLLGASFSLTKEVTRFWYQLGFNCTRLALRKDSSTGSYPGEFMKLTDISKADAKINYSGALTRLQRSFFYSLTSSYIDIEPRVLLTILKNQIDSSVEKLSNEILTDISRYTEKARSFEMVEWQVNQLVSFYLAEKVNFDSLSVSTKCLLLAKSLQNKSWQKIVNDFAFDGKKTAKEKVRKAIEQLVKSYKLT